MFLINTHFIYYACFYKYENFLFNFDSFGIFSSLSLESAYDTLSKLRNKYISLLSICIFFNVVDTNLFATRILDLNLFPLLYHVKTYYFTLARILKWACIFYVAYSS